MSFIHGLGADASAWGTLDASWPAWLAAELPQIQMWLAQYDAKKFWFGGRSSALHDAAVNMLSTLQINGLGDRDIVFVTHSLGGLVAKQLLRYSITVAQGQRLGNIGERTRGIVFLATPHRGSSIASAAVAMKIASATTVDLRKGNPWLHDLDDWFKTYGTLNPVATRSFYETDKYPIGEIWGRSAIIVERSDADPGIPQEPCLEAPGTDHITICQPAKGTPAYNTVKTLLTSLLEPNLLTSSKFAGDAEREPEASGASRTVISDSYVFFPELPEWLKHALTGTTIDVEHMTYGKANCCAELIGDFSVLVTKRALLVSTGAFVHVFIAPAAETTIHVFSAANGIWQVEADLIHAHQLARVFVPIFNKDPSFEANQDRERLCRDILGNEPFSIHRRPYTMVIFFEAPVGIGILEESAFAVALSKALIAREPQTSRDPYPPHVDGERLSGEQALAGLLLNAWHTHMSWATIEGSSRKLTPIQGIWFDRSNDNMEFLRLYRDGELSDPETKRTFYRNVLPKDGRKFWRTEVRPLNARLSIWYQNRQESKPGLCENTKFPPDETANALEALPLDYVAEELFTVFKTPGRDRHKRIGILMQLHQLLLHSAGLVNENEVQQALNTINGMRNVLGAKLACARGKGAVVALSNTSDENELIDPMAAIGFTKATPKIFPEIARKSH